MSVLVVNQSTCSGCASPSGQCYCSLRKQVENALAANFGDPANVSVRAAYRSLLTEDPRASKHSLAALEAVKGGDSEAAAKLHLKAADAHSKAAAEAEKSKDGDDHLRAADLHRKAAALHAVTPDEDDAEDEDDDDADAAEDDQDDDDQDDDEGMADNASQPRHPHTGQYQGMTHLAAKRGASPEQDDDDDDDDLDAADQDDDDLDESINTPNPACCSPGGLCPDCEALKEYLRQPAGNKKRHKEDDEDDEDEECDEDDEECNDEQTTNRRSSNMSSRDDTDILRPPMTMASIIVANAAGKAEGSNADLIGDDDSDYGYTQAGTYGRDQKTVPQRQRGIRDVPG